MYRRRRRRRRQRGGIGPAAILAARKAGRVGMKAGKLAMKYGLPILAPYLAHKGINLMNKRLKR